MERRKIVVAVAGIFLLSALHWQQEAVPVDAAAPIQEETAYIALTFDDGPRQGTTDRLLDGLQKRGASATFFVVGEQAQLYPDLIKRMQAEGHQIGNHTWSHARLEKVEDQEIAEEIGKTETLLEGILSGSHYWLRPPYGILKPGNEQQVKVPMVKWSLDTRDWESRNTEKIVKKALDEVKPNSIILLHDIYPTSVDAALKLVDILQERGYLFVTVEELLRLNGIMPQAGAFYRTGTGI